LASSTARISTSGKRPGLASRASAPRFVGPRLEREGQVAQRLRLLGPQPPHPLEERDRLVELAELAQSVGGDSQQPRVLETQLHHVGQHPQAEIAAARSQKVLGAIGIEGRAAAVLVP
jgi:hypothetical protein